MAFEFSERFYTLIKLFLLTLVAVLFFQPQEASSQNDKSATSDSSILLQRWPPRDAWLGKDKFDHLLVSAGLVASQFYLLHQEFDWKTAKSRQFAVGSTLAIGLAKEIYDHASRRGTPSWKDLLADAVGIGVAFVLVTK